MANPTTNFGWVMPTSASLVTNLPADFNTFGQGVDTSLQYLLGGTTGQVLSKTSGTNMAFTWVTPTDQTPLTTKGDLFAFSTVDARLAVGANETRLVADSTQTVGLKYVADTTNYAIAAKADLLVGTAADTLAALTVGTNGQVLTADSTVSPTGLKWATPATAASGMTLITRQSFSGVATTSTTFDGVFTSTYKTYFLSFENFSAVTDANDTYFRFRYAGPTTETGGYYWQNLTATKTATASSGVDADAQIQLAIQSGASAAFNSGQYYVNMVGNSSQRPSIIGQTSMLSTQQFATIHGVADTSRTYTGFILSSSSSNITGTVAVYGLATS